MPDAWDYFVSTVVPSIVAGLISVVIISARKMSKSSDDVLSSSIKLDRIEHDIELLIKKVEKIDDRLAHMNGVIQLHEFRLRQLDHLRNREDNNNP